MSASRLHLAARTRGEMEDGTDLFRSVSPLAPLEPGERSPHVPVAGRENDPFPVARLSLIVQRSAGDAEQRREPNVECARARSTSRQNGALDVRIACGASIPRQEFLSR